MKIQKSIFKKTIYIKKKVQDLKYLYTLSILILFGIILTSQIFASRIENISVLNGTEILTNQNIIVKNRLNIKSNTLIKCQNSTFIGKNKNSLIEIIYKNNITLQNCQFQNFTNTMIIRKSSQINILNNSFKKSIDAINLDNSNKINISNNQFSVKNFGINMQNINNNIQVLNNSFNHSNFFLSSGENILFCKDNHANNYLNNAIGPNCKCNYIHPSRSSFLWNSNIKLIFLCPGKYYAPNGLFLDNNLRTNAYRYITIIGHNSTLYGNNKKPAIKFNGIHGIKILNITFINYHNPISLFKKCGEIGSGFHYYTVCLGAYGNLIDNCNFYNISEGFSQTASTSATIKNSKILIPENKKIILNSQNNIRLENDWLGTNNNQFLINQRFKPKNSKETQYFILKNFSAIKFNTKLRLISVNDNHINFLISYKGYSEINHLYLNIYYLNNKKILSSKKINLRNLQNLHSLNKTILIDLTIPFQSILFKLETNLRENFFDNSIILSSGDLYKLNHQTIINCSTYYQINSINLFSDKGNKKFLYLFDKSNLPSNNPKIKTIKIINLNKSRLKEISRTEYNNFPNSINIKNGKAEIFTNNNINTIIDLKTILNYLKTRKKTNCKNNTINQTPFKIHLEKPELYYLYNLLKHHFKNSQNINLSEIYTLKKNISNPLIKTKSYIKTNLSKKRFNLQIEKIAPKNILFNKTLIFAGGLWSNLTSWEKTASKFAKIGFKTYLIELTGNPNIENHKINYKYKIVYKEILPSYLKYLLNHSKNKLVYIGHSNGARAILSYSKTNKTQINKIDEIILVGTPYIFSNQTIIMKKLSKEKNILNLLKSQNITNPSLYNIVSNLQSNLKELKFLFRKEIKNKISYNLFKKYYNLIKNYNNSKYQNDTLIKDNQTFSFKKSLIIGGNYLNTNSDLVVPLSDIKQLYNQINSSNKKLQILNIKHTDMTNNNKVYLIILKNLLQDCST